MIRPFTLVCMASAFGAGLYLYQSKHAAQVLDREIVRTLKQTEATRERTGMLRAEWALLNEPDRLAELARAHLSLQTLRPTQFATMADLGARLPAPVAAHLEALPAEMQPDDTVPTAQAAPAAPVVAPTVVPAATPVAPVAKPREVMSAESKPKPDAKTVAEKTVAENKPTRAAEKPVVARAEPIVPMPNGMAAPGVLASASAASAHLHSVAPPPPLVTNAEATAPGTVGAAVLRAMRAQGNGFAQPAAAPVAPPAPRSYAPAFVQPASNGPSYASPAYASPAYAPPSYAAPSYAGPAPSVLGGRPALPPPVPFAAR